MMKEKFLEIYRKNITRPGADKLLAWLETTDFFTAPGQHQVPPVPAWRPGGSQRPCLRKAGQSSYR